MAPNEIQEQYYGNARYPAGTGYITTLTKPGWANGCRACSVAMITAVAQNASGKPPPLPLEDGAAFGPVKWDRAALLDGKTFIPWTPETTLPPVIWKLPTAKTNWHGGPPS